MLIKFQGHMGGAENSIRPIGCKVTKSKGKNKTNSFVFSS